MAGVLFDELLAPMQTFDVGLPRSTLERANRKTLILVSAHTCLPLVPHSLGRRCGSLGPPPTCYIQGPGQASFYWQWLAAHARD